MLSCSDKKNKDIMMTNDNYVPAQDTHNSQVWYLSERPTVGCNWELSGKRGSPGRTASTAPSFWELCSPGCAGTPDLPASAA